MTMTSGRKEKRGGNRKGKGGKKKGLFLLILGASKRENKEKKEQREGKEKKRKTFTNNLRLYFTLTPLSKRKKGKSCQKKRVSQPCRKKKEGVDKGKVGKGKEGAVVLSSPSLSPTPPSFMQRERDRGRSEGEKGKRRKVCYPLLYLPRGKETEKKRKKRKGFVKSIPFPAILKRTKTCERKKEKGKRKYSGKKGEGRDGRLDLCPLVRLTKKEKKKGGGRKSQEEKRRRRNCRWIYSSSSPSSGWKKKGGKSKEKEKAQVST